MSFTFPIPVPTESPLVMLWLNRGQSFSAPISRPAVGATVGHDQGTNWNVLYHGDEAYLPSRFHHIRANHETPRTQLGPQVNMLSYEAQPSGAGQNAMTHHTRHDSHRMNNRVRPVCTICNESFGRAQELIRHQKDRHEERRQCLFCHKFKWTRPIRVKAHLIAKHKENFTAERLDELKNSRGRSIVAFLERYYDDQSLGIQTLYQQLFASGMS